MSIIDLLATSLNRRDEVPNRELAKQITAKSDTKSVAELIALLNHKSKDIQHDAIKVLYEIGESKPGLIAPYAKEFVGLLTSKNNRLQWGAMAALDMITPEKPKEIFAMLGKIMDASDNGSVITKDHAVNILIKLCSVKQYGEDAFMLLIEQLSGSLANQLPMYAERAIPVVNSKNKKVFMQTLTSRLKDFEKETKRTRVEKVIKAADKK